MAEMHSEVALVNARIVFWGIAGSGKTTSLRAIHARLRPDHRGELRETPTPFDPTVTYEELPIALGEIAGVRTQIQLVTVPSEAEQEPTRKRILDEVDGLVLVIDCQPGRLDENVACVHELRRLLADYGRTLDDLPFVVQYNKRDLADAYFVDELHRRLHLGTAAVFETVATETTGVLQALSTISKRVIRSLRDRGGEAKPEPRFEPEAPTVLDRPVAPEIARPTAAPAYSASDRPGFSPAETPRFSPAETPRFSAAETPGLSAAETPGFSAAERMEAAILSEAAHPESDPIAATALQAESLLDATWDRITAEVASGIGVRIGPGLSIVSVGEATRRDHHSVRIPLVLGDPEGNISTLALTIQLEPMFDES